MARTRRGVSSRLCAMSASGSSPQAAIHHHPVSTVPTTAAIASSSQKTLPAIPPTYRAGTSFGETGRSISAPSSPAGSSERVRAGSAGAAGTAAVASSGGGAGATGGSWGSLAGGMVTIVSSRVPARLRREWVRGPPAESSTNGSAAGPRALGRPLPVLGRELAPAFDDDAQHAQHDPRDSGCGGGQDAPPRVAGAGQDQEQRLAGEDPAHHGAGVGAGPGQQHGAVGGGQVDLVAPRGEARALAALLALEHVTPQRQPERQQHGAQHQQHHGGEPSGQRQGVAAGREGLQHLHPEPGPDHQDQHQRRHVQRPHGIPYPSTSGPGRSPSRSAAAASSGARGPWPGSSASGDRKSTRLNSSHVSISYAVFCLKKKIR